MAGDLTKVELSNLDKILYPQLKITKGQIIEYYIKIAPKMLDLLAQRLLVLTRFPDGIDKEGFYEKDAPMGTPPWVKTMKRFSETANRTINYVVCNDLDTLIWIANLASIEVHMTLGQVDSFEKPDLVFFDIDPEPPASFDNVVEVALLLKEKLESLGLASYVKTSGKKGLHAVLPIIPEYSFRQTREFVHQIGKHIASETPLVVSEFSGTKEPGIIFLDYLQNSHGKTMICPYSLRATPKATVSTPLEWHKIKKGLKPDELNIFTVPKSEKNPWEDLIGNRQKLEVK
ncbi:DNA polymerase domain-containing protein [Candidatus Bathyarchaeota archaeon]|nr:DNA polymerase domain-containing protein [Candidatus Bathyarchaeota archaeon]